ncbi:MAG: flippase-like domain-containing protein [Chlorobi bacterium]|nr:flippase-like domain-containing protein [Chlorobiota bacterium]
MKKVLQIVLPLLFGLAVLAYFLSGFTRSQFIEVYRSIRGARLELILFSLMLGLLSHVIRALRWKYLLEDFTERIPRTVNLILAVGLSYLVNLGIPRSGEVARALTLSKYEGLPFPKVMGTVIAERVIDMLILAAFIAAGFFLEFDTLMRWMHPGGEPVPARRWVWMGVIFLLAAWAGWYFIRRSESRWVRKLKEFAGGLWKGLFSILHSRHKGAFIIQTLIIWALYVLMLYVVMLAFEGTARLPWQAVLMAFIAGSLSIVLSNGGIGTYPVFVTEALRLYGVSKEAGFAFSITMWTSQTLILILFGLFSLFMLPVVNKTPPADSLSS